MTWSAVISASHDETDGNVTGLLAAVAVTLGADHASLTVAGAGAINLLDPALSGVEDSAASAVDSAPADATPATTADADPKGSSSR
jgi:hypothetical protein